MSFFLKISYLINIQLVLFNNNDLGKNIKPGFTISVTYDKKLNFNNRGFEIYWPHNALFIFPKKGDRGS